MPSLGWNLKVWTKDYAKFRAERPNDTYGVQWGDPDARESCSRADPIAPGPLYRVVDDLIKPYARPDATILEIGPGGGRWTRYLVGAGKIICVDINEVFRAELSEICKSTDFQFYKTRGYELGGIAAESVDFVFSFGTFVHIEPKGIEQYLHEIKRVLKPGGISVIQYADKDKPRAARNRDFSNMNAAKMEKFVPGEMNIVSHDRTLLNHSNVIRLKKAGRGTFPAPATGTAPLPELTRQTP